eukprot:5118540-Lingulodinium_polyedra.AAC.1
MEPFLSRHQTAKHGRECGTNIARAFARLDPEAGQGEDGDIPEPLWSDVLGAGGRGDRHALRGVRGLRGPG